MNVLLVDPRYKINDRGSLVGEVEAELVVVRFGDDGAKVVIEQDDDRILVRYHVRESFWRALREYRDDTPRACSCDSYDALTCRDDRSPSVCRCSCHWSTRAEFQAPREKA